jgi:hypothetical protein
MDANTCGWIAAYLEWADADVGAIGPSEPEAPAATAVFDAAQTAAAYLEWMTCACFGRRAGDRAPHPIPAPFAEVRGATLHKALQSEAEFLQLVAGDMRALAAKVQTLELH